MKKPTYSVLTWDTTKQDWTPQYGVRTGPYRLMGLRRALRKLRAMGYDGCKGDNSVLVERR